MTESDGTPDQGQATPAASGAPEPTYADRIYRSVPGVISGILLLLVAVALIVDELVSGSGQARWIALAAVPAVLLPVGAYTLRPLVRANDRRLLVRNPLRTIEAPWAAVEAIRAGYSVELLAGGKKYQIWAVPVSVRARKRATVAAAKAQAAAKAEARGEKPAAGSFGSLSSIRATRTRPGTVDPTRAWSDQVADTLREIHERNAAKPAAAGTVRTTWCWWVIAPTVLGLIALVTLIAGA